VAATSTGRANRKPCPESHSSPLSRESSCIRQTPYGVTEEGTYWFDVLFSPGSGLEDRLLTRLKRSNVSSRARAPAISSPVKTSCA